MPEKIGNHYFLRKNNGTDIYVSTKKKSGYKKAVDGSNAYTNGKKLVYITNGTLYEYRLADGKRKKIRTFPKGSDYCITASWGELYISRSYVDIGKIKVSTYAYDLKKNRLKKVKNSLLIIRQTGRYVLATPKPMAMSVTGIENAVYKITAKGIEKVWKIPWKPQEVHAFDGRIYFDKPQNGEKAEVYYYDTVKAEQQCLFSVEAKDSQQTVYVSEICDKYSVIVVYTYADNPVPKAKVYKYVYKTGKLKRAPSLEKYYK